MNSFLLSSGSSPSAVGSEAEMVNGLLRFQAEPGQYIRLVRAAEDSGEEVSVWRKKKDLLIKVDDEVQAIIEDFYATEGEGGLAIEGDVLISYDQIEADAADAPAENLVWWGEASTVDMAPPVVITPVVADAASEPVTPVAAVEPVAPVQAEPKEDSDEGGWIADNAWLIAGGVLAVAGAAYLLTREEEDESASLQVSAFAGPFLSDATVNVYDGSGQQIGTGVLDASTGQVSFDLGDYRGLVVVEVVDANGDDADYTSEATGLETDLDTSLRAIGEVTGSGRLSLSVTPLTEMAARAANLPDDLSELADSPLTSESLAVNDQIATLFGLKDILGQVTTVLDDEYNSTDGSSEAELYGDILAILSGLEQNSGGLDASLTALLNEISIADGVATLTPAGGLLLQQAQIQYENNGSGAALSGQTVIEDMPQASQFPEVVNLAELNADQSLSMDINAVSAGDLLVVTLGDQTFDVTVTEDMLDDEGTTATIDFPASALFQLDDGVHTLQLNVNGVDRQNTQLTLDLTRPSLTDYSLEKSTLLVGETSTITLVFSEAVTNFSADDVFAYEGSFANFETTDGGVTWTGVFTPEVDTEASGLNLNLSENFTDLAGNGPGYSLGLGIPVLIDTLAPAVPDAYLENDRGSSDTDGVTKQGTIIFGTPTEDGLTYKYSLDGGDSWTPTTLDYVNLAPGTYPRGDIQVVAIDENGNESEPYTHPIELVIDNVAPAAAIIELVEDTGESTTDGLTSNGRLSVTLANDTDRWQYSLDGGANWQDGDATNQIEMPEGVYASGDIIVRQYDLAGNYTDTEFASALEVDTSAPNVINGAENATEDGAVVRGTVAATDADIVGYTLVDDVAEGTLVFTEATGEYAFYPIGEELQNLASGVTRDLTFTFYATDRAGNQSEIKTVTFTVTGTDDLPIALDGNNSATEDGSAVSGQVMADGIDNDIVEYVVGTDVSEGSLDFNTTTGAYSFNPGSDFQDLAVGQTRDVTFSYYVVDTETEESNNGTVTITVTGTNDAPVVTNISDDVIVGSTITDGSVAGTDADDGIQSYTLVTDVAEGTLVLNTSTGAFTFDPGSDFDDLAENATRDVTFTYYATDVAGASSETKTVTITVTGADTTPPEVTINVFESGVLYDADVDSTPFTVSSTETGVVYLFEESTTVNSVTDITSASDDLWNQVTITAADTEVDMDISGLAQGNYRAYAVDEAGNISTQSSYYVSIADLTAPDVTLTAFEGVTTVTEGDSTTLDVQSTEAGTVYFVNTSVTVNSLSDITGAAGDQWNSVSITAADTAVDLDTTGLAAGDYVAYAVDESGNLSAASSNQVTVQAAASADPSIVVFDLVNGVSSDHSGRTFQSDVSYDIYIRINSDSSALETTPGSGAAAGATFGLWSGGEYLGPDDTIYLVGDDGTPVLADNHLSMNPGTSFTTSNTAIMWFGTGGGVGSLRAVMVSNGSLLNSINSIDGYDATRLWNGNWSGAQVPAYGYQLVVSATILSTQGLV